MCVMQVCAIIPAAGRGTRFGQSDKLSQDLGGRPLLMRTVELFAKREEVKSIVVAGPPESFDEFVKRYGATLSFFGAQVVKGGTTERWETVKNALASVPDECTHVAVHDAARPATSNSLLTRIFEAARQFDAVIPVVPVRATIKRISQQSIDAKAAEEDAAADLILGDEGKVVIKTWEIEETLQRDRVVEVQTPQVFAINLIRRAYGQTNLSGATDDAQLVERLGEKVYAIEGESTNIKVTGPGDLQLVRAILGVKAPEERPVHKRF
jgi:2-C-methyl-D-erythritol 4-phosphate cytidylyltransferase